MSRFMRRWSLVFSLGLAFGLPVGLSCGFLAGWGRGTAVSEGGVPASVLSELRLKASATHGVPGLMALATGEIDENADGIFTLDFVTGNLQCIILPRLQYAGGTYKGNILGDLPPEKGKAPNYLIVTGAYSVPAAAGNARPANSVVYIADANTGGVVAYGMVWNKQLSNNGTAQSGEFTKLLTFKARDLKLRE